MKEINTRRVVVTEAGPGRPTVSPMIVMGLDVGGTSVRCVVAADSGALLGRAKAPGANFRSSGPEAAAHVRLAVVEALTDAGVAAADIAAVTVGAAGAAAAGLRQVKELIGSAVGGIGLPTAGVRTDLDIAFRSASRQPDGVLLLAGTGAVAARFEGWKVVGRCDGMGWLLGDVGSGAWLGREVLRAVAAALDSRGPATALVDEVAALLDLPTAGDRRQPLIAAATPLPPSAWGRFAPAALALDGIDQVATALIDCAADGLLHTASAVRAETQMVFAGGLLEAGGLRRRLDEHFEGAMYAAHPVAGACAFAARTVGAELPVETLNAALYGRDHGGQP